MTVRLLLMALLLAGTGCAAEPVVDRPPTGSASSASPSSSPSPSSSATAPAPPAVSMDALALQQHLGDQLRLGAVRERTASFTSYDVTYRSRSTGGPRGDESWRISGVLNVPTGDGPFPAVVLAHGYIDPAVYERGQGMTRERGYLADQRFIALHVDYRNHAESGDDLELEEDIRLGYAADVINAVHALRGSDLPVVDDRISLMGRSMGGGVVQKALAAAPGLARAGIIWASVSSLEGENFNHFQRRDGDSRTTRVIRAHGLPEDNAEFWKGVSPRPYFDAITEPVLAIHGRSDDTCPPRWARQTQRAMVAAGVDAELEWYDDGHAFGPAFFAAMERSVRFLRQA